MFIKRMLTIFITLFSLVFLVGCQTIKITNFEDMTNLTKNPKRIVYGTNLDNFIEENDIYGPAIEYEISKEKIEQIIEALFRLKYKPFPKGTDIDLSPIINYLLLYDESGNYLRVDLGFKYDNELWYEPINIKRFLDLLDDAKVLLKQGIYKTEDKLSLLTLFGDNEFTFNKHVTMSYMPIGNYLVDNGKLVLKGRADEEFVFEIHNDYLVFISSNSKQEIIEVGTIYRLEKENNFVLKQGVYATLDKMSSVTLYGDNEFIFVRHIATSYVPIGNYFVLNNELTLDVGDEILFVFLIDGDELIFARGELVESLVPVGTVFKLQD